MQDGLLLVPLGIEIPPPENVLHQRDLVVRIINGKGPGKSEKLRIVPQDPHTERVEGADLDRPGSEPDEAVHTLPHLSRCLIGECDRTDISRKYADLVDEIGDAVHQHPRLSGACAGQNEHRPLRCPDRLLLGTVQLYCLSHSLLSSMKSHYTPESMGKTRTDV